MDAQLLEEHNSNKKKIVTTGGNSSLSTFPPSHCLLKKTK